MVHDGYLQLERRDLPFGGPQSHPKNQLKIHSYILFDPPGALRPVTPLSTILSSVALAAVHILDLFFLFIQVTPLSGK